jgi:pSer/pThr/pTyr-binding forkhead associated (FHA) protein
MTSLVTTAEDEGSRTPDASHPLTLVYLGSAENDFEGAGRAFMLAPTTKLLRFGRGESLGARASDSRLTVTVPLAWASSAHCELDVRGEDDVVQFVLRDLDSRNGTLVQGRRIVGEVPLRIGQVFEVGRSFWALRLGLSGDDAGGGEGGHVLPPLRHAGPGLDKVARSDVPVLVMGETGTGKEAIARAVHGRSGRTGAFVHLGVSGFDAGQIEEELGQGSRRAPGAARRGRGGTVYLVDVGHLDDRAQTSLLAALERLSSGDSGVRVASGSDQDLRRLVSEGRFRAALYSRLAGFEVRLPALRNRLEDIGLLVRQVGRDGERARLRLSTPALRCMLAHAWPFNREQLHACLTTASMLFSGDTIIGEDAIRDALLSSSGEASHGGQPEPGPLRH